MSWLNLLRGADETTAQATPGALVEVRDVIKSFHVGTGELTILKGVSFQVKEGEFVSIVGPSGNGKSTLLNMITGIDRPTQGEIVVMGRRVDKMSEDQLAEWRGEKVGIIFQFFQMLPALSLVQNVVLPMDLAGKWSGSERHERALHLLDMVGLKDQADKLPSMVSGGQQQRAAIARALITDPQLILADEPTGALDSKTSDSLLRLFGEINEAGQTILMVTHSVKAASHAKRVLFIKDGEIFHQLYRGELSVTEMYERIADTLTLLATGGDVRA